MPSYDNKVLTGDQLVYFSSLVKSALANKADASAVSGKQDALVFNTAYNASTNKVATMADIDDAIVDIYTEGNPMWSNVIAVGEEESTGDTIYLSDKLDEIDTALNSVPAPYTLPTATTSTLGGVKVDGTTITISNGVISASGGSASIDFEDGLWWDNDGLWVIDPTAIVEAVGSGGELTSKMVKTGEDSNTGDTIFLDHTLWAMNNAISGKQDSLVFNTTYNASSNKVATMSDITTALSGIGSFSFEIVQSLPQSNISTSKIYLVAKQTSGTNQVYTEYAYVNNAWEIIGDTSMSIDTLSNAEVATIWNTATASAS